MSHKRGNRDQAGQVGGTAFSDRCSAGKVARLGVGGWASVQRHTLWKRRGAGSREEVFVTIVTENAWGGGGSNAFSETRDRKGAGWGSRGRAYAGADGKAT